MFINKIMFNIFNKNKVVEISNLNLMVSGDTAFNISRDLNKYYLENLSIHPKNPKVINWNVIKKSRKIPFVGDIIVLSIFKGEYIWGKVVQSIEYSKLNISPADAAESKPLIQIILFDITTTSYDMLPDNWDSRKIIHRFTASFLYWSYGYALTIANTPLELIDDSNEEITFVRSLQNNEHLNYPPSLVFKSSNWCLKDYKFEKIEFEKVYEYFTITLNRNMEPIPYVSTKSLSWNYAFMPAPYMDAYNFLLTGYRGLLPLPKDKDLIDRISHSIEMLKKKEGLI
jgi:hypothetical protein